MPPEIHSGGPDHQDIPVQYLTRLPEGYHRTNPDEFARIRDQDLQLFMRSGDPAVEALRARQNQVLRDAEGNRWTRNRQVRDADGSVYTMQTRLNRNGSVLFTVNGQIADYPSGYQDDGGPTDVPFVNNECRKDLAVLQGSAGAPSPVPSRPLDTAATPERPANPDGTWGEIRHQPGQYTERSGGITQGGRKYELGVRQNADGSVRIDLAQLPMNAGELVQRQNVVYPAGHAAINNPTGDEGFDRAFRFALTSLRADSPSGVTGTPSPEPVRPAPPARPAETAGTDAVERVAAISFGEFPDVTYTPAEARDRQTGIKQYLHTHNISVARQEIYARHITVAAENLKQAIARRPSVPGTVTLEGTQFIFRGVNGEFLVANSHCVLVKSKNEKGEAFKNWYKIDGTQQDVRWSKKDPRILNSIAANASAVYEFENQIMVFRDDGGIDRVERNGRWTQGFGTESGNMVGQNAYAYERRNVDPRQQHTFMACENGQTHFINERGERVGRYTPEISPSRSVRVMPESERARISAYLDSLITASQGDLQHIAYALTGNFDTVTAEGLLAKQGSGWVDRDAISILWHAMAGGASCGNFAEVMRYCCTRARELNPEWGGKAIACLATTNHAATFLLKKTAAGYVVEKGQNAGFVRYQETFASAAEALRAKVWKDGPGPSAVHWHLRELKRSGGASQAQIARAQEIVNRGGGLIVYKDGEPDYMSFEEAAREMA